ncbi:MAG TPA: ATP-binding protein [Gemmatimonadaceae bacterium]
MSGAEARAARIARSSRSRLWFVVAALAACALARTPATAQEHGKPVRILLLYGVSPELPEIVSFTKQLRSTMRAEAGRPVEMYQEYLDFERFPDLGPQLVDYFEGKYRTERIDVIVTVGSNALRFSAQRLRAALPGVPIVFALTNDSQLAMTLPSEGVTGRFSQYPYAATLDIAQRLQPEAEQIAIIGGVSRYDSIAVAAAVRAVESRPRPLSIIMLQGLSYGTLLERLAHLPPRTIALATSLRQDQAGQRFVPGELISEISRVSAAPVYGYMHMGMGQGFVGGAFVLPEEEAVAAGKLIMRVIQRRPGERLPPPALAPAVQMADWRQLRRWNLDEARLPASAEVLNRTPGIWERYRIAILASLGLIAIEAALIALLLVERERRRRAQLAIEDQMAYEQTIADLTTDAVRHSPGEEIPALEDALARVSRYAEATRAVLVQYPDGPTRPPLSMTWSADGVGIGTTMLARGRGRVSGAGAELEIPLIADGVPIGALTLYRPSIREEWSPRLIARLGAAGELIAGAMARARSARAVRAGEELNRAVLASLSTEIAILDREGVIIRVNEAWRELARQAGVAEWRDAFIGESYLDECRRAEQDGCEEAGDVRRGIEGVLERRAVPFRYEYHSTTPSNRWCEMRVDSLEHEDGGAIVTHLDITERRLADQKAEETRRQVAHMGRVAMIGELAATVSHELRQPLAAIRANAESGALLLGRNPADVQEAVQIFRDIVDEDIRAAEIIDRTRMLLRNEMPKSAEVDINDVCRQAVQMLARNAIHRQTDLTLSLDARASSVVGDPVQLQQVVLNLVLNAIEAMSTSLDPRSVTVCTRENNEEVEISVHDTGPGLLPDVQRHLFESFYSTKAQGLGMGLVIVRSIVERHHGRVSASNGERGGAVFRVVLPKSLAQVAV